MVTSGEFDKVLVPVDYQKDVLMRTFDSLIGFNKKNKKGKFMKAIKEEYRWDPVLGKPVFVDREKEVREKSKGYKVIKLDKPKKEKNNDIKVKRTANTVDVSEPEKKETKKTAKKVEEVIKSTLVNKNGKTLKGLERERKESSKLPSYDDFYRNIKQFNPNFPKDHIINKGAVTREEAIRKAHEMEREARAEAEMFKNFVEDTHYTVDEIVDYAWKHSKKTREKFLSDRDFRKALIKKKALRDLYDNRMIEVLGHKPEDAKKKVSKEAKVQKAVAKEKAIKEKAELETDINKIADWFWAHKADPSYRSLFDNTNSKYTLARLIKNDDRGLKFFAKIMRDHGYKKAEEKPAEKKVVLIKKGQGARGFEEDDDISLKEELINTSGVSNTVSDNAGFTASDAKYILSVVPSALAQWAKRNHIRLTSEMVADFTKILMYRAHYKKAEQVKGLNQDEAVEKR